MKNIIIPIVIFSSIFSYCQTATIISIDSGGESSTGTIHAVYTIGEIAVNEYQSSSLNLSEGFIQIDLNNTLSAPIWVVDNDVTTYPNPTTDIVYIKSFKEVNSIALYTISGKLVFSNNGKKEIDISHLPSGVYLAKIEIDHQVMTRKIIKK